MTSEYEPNDGDAAYDTTSLEEIVEHVKHVRTKLDDISTRLEDSYRLLRDILDATSENGVTEYDLYDNDDEA